MKTQANKLLLGCGNKTFLRRTDNVDITYDCGVKEFHLCEVCQARLSQYLSDCKDNLEFLLLNRETRIKILIEVDGYEALNGLLFEFNQKIDFLKSEIKKLEKAGIK